MLSRTKYQGILVEVDQCVGDIKDKFLKNMISKEFCFISIPR